MYIYLYKFHVYERILLYNFIKKEKNESMNISNLKTFYYKFKNKIMKIIKN